MICSETLNLLEERCRRTRQPQEHVTPLSLGMRMPLTMTSASTAGINQSIESVDHSEMCSDIH